MKILLVHNSYQQPGGEDRVYAMERQLLESHGHRVIAYHRSNNELQDYLPHQQMLLPRKIVWSKESYRQLQRLLRYEKPQVVHVHNTFLQISPSIFDACREEGVPVVQTLHNYRLLCPAANFFRAGRVCEECREKSLWRSVRHACYRNSTIATSIIALMLALSRKKGSLYDSVANFIALSDFARRKFVEGGLPGEKISVKPNFVSPDPGMKSRPGEGAVFVGRLSAEKGLGTLLQAWQQLSSPVPLQIVGDGPMREELEQMAFRMNLPQVTFLGRVNSTKAIETIKEARVLILPSKCYENFPMTIIEAYSCGTPVICSRLGSMQEIVVDHKTGLHFNPGDPRDLAEKVERVWNHNSKNQEMGRAAREEFEQKYTAEANYSALMGIYQQALSTN